MDRIIDNAQQIVVSTGLWIAYLIVTIIMIMLFVNMVDLFVEWYDHVENDCFPFLALNVGALILIGGINYNIWAKQCELAKK